MNDQNIANDWAEPGEDTPATESPAESSARTTTKKWSTQAVAGIAAACLASGVLGFGIANLTAHHDGPRQFSEAPGGHFGPDGQRGSGGPGGLRGPDGHHPPRPAIQGQPGLDDDAMGDDGDDA